MGIFFDREETLAGYYEMASSILTKYGILRFSTLTTA